MLSSNVAKLKADLAPHCQIKKRAGGKYYDVYFMVHPKDRPEGWPASIHLGRTDQKPHNEIIKLSYEYYAEYEEFVHEHYTGERLTLKRGTIPHISSVYQQSRFFTDLAEKTQGDYLYYLKEIEAWSLKAKHPHMSEMTVKAITKWLNTYEDTPIKQRRAKTVLSLLFKVALQEGEVEHNLTLNVTLYRRKTEKRKLVIWEDCHVEQFVEAANKAGHPSIGKALIMGLETAQRRGDVLNMHQYKDWDPHTKRLKFKQSKTGKMVNIRATKRLAETLDELPATQIPLFINEKTGGAWHDDTFCHKFREIADSCGLQKHIFMHTRHSSILYLYRAGVDTAGIASITGHSPKTVDQMLENHYLELRDQEVADAAITKLEDYRVRQIPNLEVRQIKDDCN